jgi:hypothetical protein
MGLGIWELMIILFLVGGFIALIALFAWRGSRMIKDSGESMRKELKTCPYCAEQINRAAKICRYCQRDVTDVEIENKPPRGLFQ